MIFFFGTYSYMHSHRLRPDFFLFVDLRDFFFRLRVGGGDEKTNSENDQLTGHFRAFFHFQSWVFWCVFLYLQNKQLN